MTPVAPPVTFPFTVRLPADWFIPTFIPVLPVPLLHPLTLPLTIVLPAVANKASIPLWLLPAFPPTISPLIVIVPFEDLFIVRKLPPAVKMV